SNPLLPVSTARAWPPLRIQGGEGDCCPARSRWTRRPVGPGPGPRQWGRASAQRCSQVERAGLLKLLGSALDGLTAERQEAGRGEMARLCGQLAAQLEGAKAGCQQELARALQGLQAERASEPQGVRQELELEAERLRAELASAEQRVKDGLQDRQRLSRAVEGARRDMAGLQAELERLRAAPEPSARELREEVAQLRRQLAAEKEAQKRIQRQADTDVVRSLVALRDLDANFFSPAR
ncbi:unnamed protein product, partial [Prorocentrum cordatum]